MSQANSNHTTPAPADSSRRRFLTVAAAASAVSAGSLAVAAMPTAALQACSISDDSMLLKLEERIFQHKAAIDAMEPEADRLDGIWSRENHRLHDEFEATRTGPTFSERKAIVEGMPEYLECMRLRHLQASNAKRLTAS
jgi:hypothetical protein